MSNTRSVYVTVVLPVLLGMLAALAGGWSYLYLQAGGSAGEDDASAWQVMTVLPDPLPLGNFQLQDQQGLEFGNARLKGHWSLLFFGYTHCPDICPTTLYAMQRVKQSLLAADSKPAVPQVVFVSVDPDRDTVERLSAYVPFFDPEFIGVTGDAQQIALLAGSMGASYHLHNSPQELARRADYPVDHSASIFLINPQGRLQALITPPLESSAIAGDYQALLSAAL